MPTTEEWIEELKGISVLELSEHVDRELVRRHRWRPRKRASSRAPTKERNASATGTV